MNEWVLLGIGFLLTLGTGVFVAAEFALVNLDRNELESRRERGESGLNATISALKHTSTHLSSAQLGITLTTLLTGYTMEPAITSLLGDVLLSIGIPEEWVRGVGAIIAMTIATVLSMVVGELIPKNFALAVPLATAKIVVPLQRAFTTVFRPAVSLLNGSANALIRAFGIEPKEELSGARTAEELSSLVRRSAIVGVLENEKAVLLSRTLRFSSHTAADVMTPRPRIEAIRADQSVQEVLELAHRTGHSRFPVTGDDIDDIVGVAHVRLAAAVPREKRSQVPVGAIKADALTVPETVTLDALLTDLRGGGFQMAVVVDEYGGTSGIATLEDLVEEIVGELIDEHDRSNADPAHAEDELLIDAMLRPDEVHDRLNIHISDEGPFETVGGFVMHTLGRIPEVGDTVELETGVLEVERMDARRVERVRFHPGEGYVSREQLLAELEANQAAERADEQKTGRAKGGEQ